MARQNIFICDGKRINSIGDLYDSFNFEELKRCIAVGKLQFWLRANGHDVEAVAVEKLDLAAADADLQLLVALNAPEDKRNAFLARKREEEAALLAAKQAEEEAARLAAKQAEEEANAVKQELALKHRVVISHLVQDLYDAKGDDFSDVFYYIKPIVVRECYVQPSQVYYQTKLATVVATGDQLNRICRTFEEDKKVSFTDADISQAKTVGDLAEVLYRKMVSLAFLSDAPQEIVKCRRKLLSGKVGDVVSKRLGIAAHNIDIHAEFVAYLGGQRFSKGKIRADAEDVKAICDRLAEELVISFSDEEIAGVKTVGDIVDLVECKMVEDSANN